MLGRTAGKEITFPNTSNDTVVKQKVTYIKHGDKATNLPCKVEYVTAGNDGITSSENIRYAYDKRGNIEKVYKNGKLTQRYKYDSLNRLIREDNREFKKTYLLAYDDNGNIISKRSMTFNLLGEEHIEERFDSELNASAGSEGMFTPTATEEIFSYDGDKLVQYGFANYVNYDKLGCPSSYNGNECEWSFGKLKKFGETNFTYDGYGRRLSRGNTTYTYDSEGRLQSQNSPEGSFSFIYDESGIAGIEYNSEKYLFRKDSQGNVTAILNSTGFVEAKYVYDAWGNCKVLDSFGNEIWDSFNIGVMNPIRYRGYCYDTETNLYYLNTRYYDPTTGRFISPDSLEYLDPETINGLNLYAYCGNNPVMRTDSQGTNWWDDFCNWWSNAWNTVSTIATYAFNATINFVAKNWDIILGVYLVAAGIALSIVTFGAATVVAGIVCGAVLGAAFGALSAYSRGENVVMGMLTGMLVGATGGVSPLAAAFTATGMSLISDRVNGKTASGKSVVQAVTNGVVAAVLAGGSNGFANLIIDGTSELLIKNAASFVSGFIFSGYSFVTDALSNLFWRKH